MTRVVLLALVAALTAVALPDRLAAQEKGPDTVILKGAPLGGVKFNHAAHRTKTDCVTCHHAARPEKPKTKEQQACRTCHTSKATPPMKTPIRGAFHDPMAKSGTCLGCHTKEAAAGKKSPLKCPDCHKKENV